MKRICGKENQTVAQLCAIYIWFVNLIGTDSFYSVYVLIALLGVLAMRANAGRTVSRSAQIWIGGLSAVFSAAQILANYQLFLFYISPTSVFQFAGSFLGGYFIARNILLYLLDRVSSPWESGQTDRDQGVWKLFVGIVASIVLIDGLYLFFCEYPGVLSMDSVGTIGQILSGAYNNVMPFWHTMTVQLFVKLGLILFGEINGAVALFHCAQILFLAACFAYALVTLYQAGVPRKYILVLSLIYALAPYNIVYSVTLWKDVLFGAATLLLITAFYRILRQIGKSTLLNYAVFAVGAAGFCLWRTNGWYAFAVTAVAMLFLLGKKQKKLLHLILAILLICWVLLNPVLAAMDGGEMDLVEAFAVPFQQLARYVVQEGWMDEAEKELLEMAFDLEKVREVYHPNSVDPVKFTAFRRENITYIQEHLGDYLRLYLQFGIRRPDIYLEAWVEETKGFWSGGYPDPMYDLGVVENTIGVVHRGGQNRVSDFFTGYFNVFQWIEVTQPLCGIGLHVWALIACCLVNALKKRGECLLSIPLIVLSVGLWIGTPVVAEFRYGYPMILTAPVILAVTLFPKMQD